MRELTMLDIDPGSCSASDGAWLLEATVDA
jgi:hypothetical protein